MKRLLVGLLFSVIFSCAVAQSAVCLPQLKALPDTDQLLKRGEWTVEFNNLGIPVYSGLTHLNGAYTYRVTPWLALGGGAGIQYLSDIFLSAQVFARIYVEVPQWTVSPCLILDGGGGFEVGSLFPYPTANLVLGLRFRLRNQHAFTFGSALNYPFWGLPLLHVGYTF